MFLKSLTLIMAALYLSVGVARAEATSPVGTWLTSDGKAHIKIEPCGSNLCGTIVWLWEPLYPDTGTPKIDKNNPEPALRSLPIIGSKIFDMKQDVEGIWRGGIYNGEDGNTYDANLYGEDGKLYLQGCVFFSILCKTQVWVPFKE